jgi:hypothetical protein
MEHITQQYKDFASTESPYFSLILDAMYHTKKEEGKLFLNLMNNIVDYCINTNIQNGAINYQIIHLPNCSDWARELLIRFIIYKTTLTFNQTTIKRFTKSIQNVIVKNDRKEIKLIQDRNKYYRKLSKIFNTNEIPDNNSKSLIITKEQDLLVKKSDKNPWIYDFYTEKITDKEHNLILSTNITAFELEKTIKLLEKGDIPNIENIFIFHSPNKSKVTNSYNKTQLERLNRYGFNIKNCIIFSLSDQPFKLYHTIDNIKCRLASSVLNKTVNKYDDFDGFITFTQRESEFLFNKKINQETYFIDCKERSFFTSEIDQFLDYLPNNLKFKNNLSLSFNNNLQNCFVESVEKEIKGFSKALCADFFNLLKELWFNEIKNRIEKFIGNSQKVGLVIPKNTPKTIKNELLSQFQKYDRKIKFYCLEDFNSNINSEKIIILQYRYTNKFYKSYPNSFDPLPLNDDQKVLNVLNRLTHNDYFEWNTYWYNKDLNGLLFSKFREEKLKWKKKFFSRPVLPEVLDYIDEAENEAKAYQTEKCKIYYKDGSRPKEYLACERVIYKENDSFHIAELKDISNLENIQIQRIDEIIDQVKSFISKNTEDKTRSEIYLRRDPKFKLTETEIHSTIELWKFLLKREIERLGEEVVYEAIFANMSENERISLNTFKQWYDFENTMILPRSRKHQKALLGYLGFDLKSAYFLIMIAKKISNIQNSRFLNSQIETLLRKSLVKTINEKIFDSLSNSHSDIFTLLDIKSIEDLNALIGLLDISLTPIQRIEYDQD